jgi:hypothetical protein
VNDYHSPYDGISSLVPEQSTTKRDTIAWLPYLRDQQSFHGGALLDFGLGVVHFRDGYEPRGDSPFQITPELSLGSYFENLVSHSRRFPNYLSVSSGLEWRFHFRGSYFGLRGVIENVTDSRNPLVVNNMIDSSQYGTFSEFEGRVFTASIRLIGAKK